ncbi:MAG: hypothetical protein AAF928_04745 [Myxococcota bacterium]
MACLVGCGARTELELPPPLPPPAVCGDGTRDRGEACDLGDDNRQIPALELIVGADVRAVMPVDTTTDAVTFYDYRSESSHTGFEGRDLGVWILQRDVTTGSLNLGAHFGIDEDETGITLESGAADLDLVGVPAAAVVVVEDEPGQDEVTREGDVVRGRWEFFRNSDGVMLEGLPFPGAWEITASVTLIEGVTQWAFVGAEGESVPIDPRALAILRAYDVPSSCRPDCTVPTCGDGIVDGGEVCDDGNRADGDGCAGDCAALDGP